jgi:hypothetical protein
MAADQVEARGDGPEEPGAGGVAAVRAQLPVLYEELGREIAAAAPVCDLSGRCCRFREYGHTLFLSRAEAQLLFQQPFAADAPIDDSGCPYQVGALCTARERRPLGCRVYYCDPQYAGVGEQLSERYLKRLKDLHDEHQAGWDYRPLVMFLREEKNSGRTDSAEVPEER